MSVSGDGYVLEYDERDEREAEIVVKEAERALPELKSRFGPRPTGPVRIVLASSMDAFRETVRSDMPGWAAGVAVGSRNLVVLKPRRLTFRRGTTLRQTVRHELTHIVVGANYAMGRLPRWLTRPLDSPRLLRWAARRADLTRARDLGETTLDMLRGELPDK